MAVIAAVSLLPKAADVVSAALGGLGIGGETGTDKRRKERAAQLEAAALAGDRSAVAALEFDAFDPRGRSAADTRTPRDGKYSPADVRQLAVAALKRVARAGIPLTSRDRYAQLQVPVPQTQTQEIVRAIVTPVAEKFAPEVGRAAADVARPAIGNAALYAAGAVVAVVLIAWLVRRG